MSYVAELENQLKEAKQSVERRDKMRKLCKNREFRELILEHFLVEECARYVHTSADPNLRPEAREDAMAMAQAAGHFKRFIRKIEAMGTHAEGQIVALNEAIAEARAEEI